MPGVALRTLAQHIDMACLREAYRRTRKDGAVGVDQQAAEQYAEDLERNLQSLLDRAKSGTYSAPPVRRVHIPKGDGSQRRPIGVPTFEDKILQRAVTMVLEAVYEQDFLDCSYGFRPGRSAHQALEVLREGLMTMGGGWVLEVDIRSFFDTLDHGQLRTILRKRVQDGVLLRLIGKWLHAGVLEEGDVTYPDAGTPQGGVISPLLANVYLNGLDRAFEERHAKLGRMVRYADDLVVMCKTEPEARRALAALQAALSELGLELKHAKTRIVHLAEGGEGFDFLGFHHRYVRGRTRRSRNITFLARWPSCRAMQHARDRIRELTARERLLLPVEDVVQDVNTFLRGWVGYFRYGNSARPFDKIDRYAVTRLSLFVAKRHRAPTRYGWKLVAYESPNRMGLIKLNGRVIAPRPNRPWREKPNAGGERRR